MTQDNSHLKCSFCGKSLSQIRKMIAGPGVYICDECVDLTNEILNEEIQGWNSNSRVTRSIEFPPEYRNACTSILTYFNHILQVKYPDMKIKIRIEQENLTLRMIIDTPTGQKEIIEKTLEEYSMVVMGKMPAEIFLENPFEVMALKNKLEITYLELRQTKELLNFSQNHIVSQELHINRLYSIIEKGLQSTDKTFGVIEKMTGKDGKNYDLRGAKFGGGFATEGGFQTGGTLLDLSSSANLTEAAQQIQELLQQLNIQGMTLEEAQEQAARDLATQAEKDPSVMGKLVQWGKSLADTAGKTTVSEAAKGVVKLALQLAGIPLP